MEVRLTIMKITPHGLSMGKKKKDIMTAARPPLLWGGAQGGSGLYLPCPQQPPRLDLTRGSSNFRDHGRLRLVGERDGHQHQQVGVFV